MRASGKLGVLRGFSVVSVLIAGPQVSCHPVPSAASQHSPSAGCPACQEVWMAWMRGGFLAPTHWEAGGEGLPLHIPCPSPLSFGSDPHSIP